MSRLMSHAARTMLHRAKSAVSQIREWFSTRAMLEYRRNRYILVRRPPGDEPAIESPAFFGLRVSLIGPSRLEKALKTF